MRIKRPCWVSLGVRLAMLLLMICLLAACGRGRPRPQGAAPRASATPAAATSIPATSIPATAVPATAVATVAPAAGMEESANAAAPDACTPTSVTFAGLGGEVSWSPDSTTLLFDRRDDAGIYQLHLMSPDGSNDRCISCQEVPGGPKADRHKGFASWHPSGRYIVTQAEMEDHAPFKRLTEPGRGAWNNLYLLTPDGQQWWPLTDYSGWTSSGVLNPRFSHDGSKLFWAEKIGRATGKTPFGQWQVVIADFVDDAQGPRLENRRDLRPGGGSFYESHGFSPDDTKLLFTSDSGLSSPYGLDIFTYTPASDTLVNLTNSPAEWDEHAAYGPRGNHIAFMSSRCCPGFSAEKFNLTNLSTLQSEAYVMDADGANWQQLTHFNTAGFAEYDAESSVATVVSWKPDGSRLAVAQLFTGPSYDSRQGRKLWIVDFGGVCD